MLSQPSHVPLSHACFAHWTGNLWTGRPARGDGKPITTLAVSFMMALKAGCIGPTDSGWRSCNYLSRGLYFIGLIACVVIAVATAAEPKFFDVGALDWFAWTSWGTIAASELLLIAMNIMGRCQQVTNSKFKETGARECLASMVRRVPFGAGWQAVLVTVVNAATSVAFMLGLLVVHMQMMLETDNEHIKIVDEDLRNVWTQMWTVVYLFVTFGLIWAAFLDPSRLGDRVGDIATVSTWAVEFEAWRVLTLCLIMPVIGFAFGLYANLCCEGKWEY